MSGFTKNLVTGFADLLDDASLGLSWNDDGSAYDDDETGIVLFDVPPSPDGIVTLSTYGLGDDPVYADSDIGLQIRTRMPGEDPTVVTDLDDLIADALIGQWPMTLSTGIRVVTLVRTSDVSLGKDANRRWSHSSNYRLGLHRPGSHRL